MVDMTSKYDTPRAEIEELKSSTIWWSLSPFFLAAFALYLVAVAFTDPIYGAVPGVILLLLSSAVWCLRQMSHYLAAALLLVIGCFGVNLLLIAWSVLPDSVIFLALLVGLTAVLIGLPCGIATAVVCTLFLHFGLPQIEAVQRYVAIVHIWGVIWLIWLTSRPLLSASQWFEASHMRSRVALEESRDYQFQLRQALDDLTEA